MELRTRRQEVHGEWASTGLRADGTVRTVRQCQGLRPAPDGSRRASAISRCRVRSRSDADPRIAGDPVWSRSPMGPSSGAAALLYLPPRRRAAGGPGAGADARHGRRGLRCSPRSAARLPVWATAGAPGSPQVSSDPVPRKPATRMLESEPGLVLYVREGCHLCEQFLIDLSLELSRRRTPGGQSTSTATRTLPSATGCGCRCSRCGRRRASARACYDRGDGAARHSGYNRALLPAGQDLAPVAVPTGHAEVPQACS